MTTRPLTCTPVSLPREDWLAAGYRAIEVHPANAPFGTSDPLHIAGLTSKFWGDRVRDLTVGFMEPTSPELRRKFLAYANKWGEFSKARFRWAQTDPTLRVSRGPGGYSSFVGTDALSIPADRHTMNLEAFGLWTPDSEFDRVVVHEFGHALCLVHEHQRAAIIARLDRERVIARFMQTQGWSREQVVSQTLVPLEEDSLMGGSPADETSIMAYHFDGDLTLDGVPILGGLTLSDADRKYFANLYPPDPPAPPPGGAYTLTLRIDPARRTVAGEFAGNAAPPR